MGYDPDKDYIVFDLEFTQWRSDIFRDEDRNFFVWDKGEKLILNVPYIEIIEIGAVRVRNHQIVDTFHTYVQPSNMNLSSHVIKLTGITSDKLVDAPYFTQAFEQFLGWIGQSTRPVQMCAWGKEDRKQLYRDCFRQMVDTSPLDKLFVNQLDVQTMMTGKYNKLFRTKSPGVYGLERALDMLSIKTDNRRHTALGDAMDTVKIMIAINTGYLEILKSAA